MTDKILLIGTGAGGNKAAIDVVEKGIIPKDDLVLVNGTKMDVPLEYREKCYVLEKVRNTENGIEKLDIDEDGGFGKERTSAKDSTLYALKEGNLPLKSIIAEGGYKYVVIVTSTEGGSGSGSSVIIAKYISKVCKDKLGKSIPVHIIGLSGFGNDPRGLQNTIEFLQDIVPGITCHIIKNDTFLYECNDSKIKAEIAANNEVCNQIKVAIGALIRESTQNIDTRDRYKVVNTPGYQQIEYKELTQKIKNKKDFENVLIDMIDNSHNMPTRVGIQRFAVIMNMNENSLLYCDDYSVIKDRYGICYEEFTHRQSEKDMPEFIAIIASGMKMPIDEAKEILDNYNATSAKVDTEEDEFFAEIQGFKGNSRDRMFDMIPSDSTESEDDFFAEFKKTEAKKEEAKKQQDKLDEY